MLNYPKKVTIGDITIRDGFQNIEKFIPTEAKLWIAEQLIFAGFKKIEVTNFGNPIGMPQFKDANDIFKALFASKKVGHLLNNIELTAVTIREKAIERAIQTKLEGNGPNRILLMVSTSESHHIKNSGLSLDDYWKMSKKYIKKAHDAGIQVCGTVSTIWGCPIEGRTVLSKAIEFTHRWFDIGADEIEHADHDGSASPDRVFKYFNMLLDEFQDPEKHIVHFHTTRGWGLANVLSALQTGMTRYEATMGGIGGQPANFIDGIPVSGTGSYYVPARNITGLNSIEDMVVMMDEMGIDTQLDVDSVLRIGNVVERIVGYRLRSETIKMGRIPKKLSGKEMLQTSKSTSV